MKLSLEHCKVIQKKAKVKEIIASLIDQARDKTRVLRKILCKRNSTKPRLWQRKQSIEQAESLTVSLPRGRCGMRAACGVNAAPAVGES